MIVLTVVEAAMDIGLTPRNKVGHQLAVDEPKKVPPRAQRPDATVGPPNYGHGRL